MNSGAQPEVVGRYAVFGPIASGGMATVHLGRLAGPGGFSRTVAIKRMRPAFLVDPSFVSMFADEARVAGRIRHPNVVPVIDVVSTDNELLLVMEYVQGETLARLLRLARDRGTHMPPMIGAAIVRDALLGLHAAHEAKDERGELLGIVHRDVSPQNILVGTDGVARVLDFGVAKAAGRSQVTRDGEVKGKLAYMAPEQLSGDVTRATDVFACAAILWEVLTGARLFRGATDAETIMRIVGAEIKRPSELLPGLVAELDDVVLRGLARSQTDRYPSAREMAMDLTRLLDLPDAVAIGEWVADIAGPFLRERERVVTEIESFVGMPESPRPRQTRTPRRLWLAGAILGGAAVVAVALVALSRHPQDATASTASASTALTSSTPAPPVSAATAFTGTPVGSPPLASALSVEPPRSRPTKVLPPAKPVSAPRIPDRL